MLAMGTVSADLANLEHAIAAVLDDARDGKAKACEVLTTQGAAVVQYLPLYVEWLLRSMSGHPYPLPDCCGELGIEGALMQGRRSFVSGFQEFHMRVRQMPETFERVIQQVGATLFGLASVESERDHLMTRVREVLSGPRYSVSATFGLKEKEPEKVAVPVQRPVQEAQKPTAVHGIRQTASEELQKLRTNDPHEYEQLKSRYVASLEPSRRKLLSDVQKRMTPETFEQHLRHSLVKFMIEHPTAWRSTSAQRIAVNPPKRSTSGSSAIWGSVD
jgi:hypothetical protein